MAVAKKSVKKSAKTKTQGAVKGGANNKYQFKMASLNSNCQRSLVACNFVSQWYIGSIFDLPRPGEKGP